MSDEIQQTRYDRLIRRVCGIIGPGSKVSQVITELFPMIDVENMPGELLVLTGTAIAFRSTRIVAGADDANASQLANPAGSGKIITITRLDISSNLTHEVVLTLANPLLTISNGFGEFRDGRNSGPAASAAVGNTRIQTAIAVNPGYSFQGIADRVATVRDDNGIAVLSPGEQFTVGISTVAAKLMVGYFWRERPAEQSELQIGGG